jgi:hypothetical protein
MRIFWRFASDSGTVTATSTADGYSVDELQRSTLAPVWKSEGSTSAVDQVITIDLGSAQAITAFALLGHNLQDTATTASVTLTYASDSGFTTGTGTISGTSVTDDNWYEYFASISRQYWRVTIPKAAAANQIEAGRVVLGSHYTPSYALRPGFSIGAGSSTARTLQVNAGQRYSSLGVTPRVMAGTMPGLSDTDYDEITLLQQTYQNATPFIVSLNWETDPTRRSIYGTLSSVRPLANVAVDKWEWNLSIREVF